MRYPLSATPYRIAALLVLVLAPAATALAERPNVRRLAADHPYRVAVELTKGRFAGWGYGSDPSKQTLDCVLFVREVVRELAERTGQEVSRSTERAILISGIDFPAAGQRLGLPEPDRAEFRTDADFNKARRAWTTAVLNGLVEARDPQIRGVQTALVDAGLGHAVPNDRLRPGDFVQYWYRAKNNSRWLGHSGVVGEIKRDGRVVLWGSHSTILADPNRPNRKAEHGGVGPSVPIRIRPDHLYAVRWGPAPE
ncbi:MAG: hypothetical protein AAF288_08415 [Planctomycetota bacterium]